MAIFLYNYIILAIFLNNYIIDLLVVQGAQIAFA